MHRRALLGSAAAAGLSACAAPPSVAAPGDRPSPQAPTAPIMAPGADGFELALYRAIAAPGGNQFVSPHSILSAFALLYPGAVGATATEIATTFGFDPDVARQIANTRSVAAALAAQTGGSEFTSANAAWVERTLTLRADYARVIRDQLGAAIEPVPFIANQRQALRTINAWAARETRDRIREILTQQDPARRLVLTNAVYFKGRWQDPFAASGTRDGDFFTEGGATQRGALDAANHARALLRG